MLCRTCRTLLLRERFARISENAGAHRGHGHSTISQATEHERKQVRVVQLISAYRQRGHQQAALDPLASRVERRAVSRIWNLGFHELSVLRTGTRTFQVGTAAHRSSAEATRRQRFVEALGEDVLRHTVGAEFMHIVDTRTSATGS